MDRISATLALLIQLGSEVEANPTTRFFLPVDDLVALAFGDTASEQERRTISDAILSTVRGTQSFAAGVGIAAEHLQLLEQRDAAGILKLRLERFADCCREALALHSLLTSPTLRAGEALLERLQAIHTFSLPAGSNTPATTIVVAVPQSSEKRRVPLSKHPLLDRIEVFYEQRSPYPYLTLNVASMSETLDWTTMRSQFQFTDTSAEGLQLLHRNDRKLGRICVERLQSPYLVVGHPFAITINAPPEASLTAMTIMDVNELPIARCLRIASPPIR